MTIFFCIDCTLLCPALFLMGILPRPQPKIKKKKEKEKLEDSINS
jgi:hypothetical protein